MRDAFLLETCVGIVAFASIPKCGQHTLAKYKTCMVSELKVLQFPLRIAFIREPFDRFLSAFHFITQNNYTLDGKVIRSYEQFVDIAITSGDDHLLPQSMFIDKYNTLIKLENMSSVIKSLTGKEITKENTSVRHEFDTSYMKHEVMKRYLDDSIMYENIGEAA
ncbi:MAG: sulfotransferase family 2 domain-containing protein [Colwellia sp.]|nr:sulfotransferase family 2 domain-containing protein [Colwellia sp.]